MAFLLRPSTGLTVQSVFRFTVGKVSGRHRIPVIYWEAGLQVTIVSALAGSGKASLLHA